MLLSVDEKRTLTVPTGSRRKSGEAIGCTTLTKLRHSRSSKCLMGRLCDDEHELTALQRLIVCKSMDIDGEGFFRWTSGVCWCCIQQYWEAGQGDTTAECRWSRHERVVDPDERGSGRKGTWESTRRLHSTGRLHGEVS